MLVAFRSFRSFGIILFLCLYLFSCVWGLQRYGESGETLHVGPDPEDPSQKIRIIERPDLPGDEGQSVGRHRRAALPAPVHKNISIWTTHLNDSHQQLMVHWVGEGSTVIICLARDSTPRNKDTFAPSALFISYDYGQTFVNRTEAFKLSDGNNSDYAQLDKFFNHPRYPEICVFVDTTNKKLYYTENNGETIFRSDLNFSPSEVAFDEERPQRLVVLDKVSPNREMYASEDGGRTFAHIQSFVKAFYWSSTQPERFFYMERWKLGGQGALFKGRDPSSSNEVIFDEAKDFQIKGDFIFVTKNVDNSLDLFISHKHKPFVKARFQTTQAMKRFHIADVTEKRMFVSVMHSETISTLFVSEINDDYTQFEFITSIPQVLSYFPGGNWKDSWLEDVTEDPFTDLYRVEGLRGVYIASKVETIGLVTSIGPENVASVITYDHGATWSPIRAPIEDENGQPFHCHLESSCSLHLCQKFSQLFPVTRSASIMSSKSAPGIIMATGVMGKSLKGIPGVYLSRDAGVSWTRILKDYYFFNYGDHGGILVAVKYFKSQGETRRILYSTNEGVDWNSYEFNAADLRIYGLMTEPGENTTTFTMFGSANEQHQWIIITIDLRNAFARNCTAEDYKYWSPSVPHHTLGCVMGVKDTYQRRLAHTNCYNGLDYQRPVKRGYCECTRHDFECDFGFTLKEHDCVIETSIGRNDTFAIPKDCSPGKFYNRTRGYRKIEGNLCKLPTYSSHSPDVIPCPLSEPTEFLLVAAKDKIARIDLADNSIVYPVINQENIVAIDYDMKNNCIYWADIFVDKIFRQCFGLGSKREVIVDSDLASIEGMALDWISNVLFFVDGARKKIEAVRTDFSVEGRTRTTIISAEHLAKPRGIAVHPRAGFLFWTDWDNKPSISRSNLDGKDIRVLFTGATVQWPNGIAIDMMSDRIYWVDAMKDYIASADLNGHYFRIILSNNDNVAHPFAVAVLKDKMFWDDWKVKSIFMADKEKPLKVTSVNETFSGLMDLKAYAHFIQHGTNACSFKNTSCEAMCLGGPRNTFSCLCPDGFTMTNGKCYCPNGLLPNPNFTCQKTPGGNCSETQFECANNVCIEARWRCNNRNDCGDNSDEERCHECDWPGMFKCDNGTTCLTSDARCDGKEDCADFSDERDCPKPACTATQFRCSDGQCIDEKMKCDGDLDCGDGSDELHCRHFSTHSSVNCTAHGFSCQHQNETICIPNAWVCDGENDCPEGEDETDQRCKDSTCAPYMFRCASGKCIYKTWVCDGENDCSDTESSDEKNCSNIAHTKIIPHPEERLEFPTNTTCLNWMFKCANGNCLPYWWRCDDIDDCGDNSDEIGCGATAASTTESTATWGSLGSLIPRRTGKCGKNQFTCSPGVCIPLTWVCDGAEDCVRGEDERGCSKEVKEPPVVTCGPLEMACADGSGCVLASRRCDGRNHCADGSDELHCSAIRPNRTQCFDGAFACADGIYCVPAERVCDYVRDCLDESDEANCNEHLHRSIVRVLHINSTSIQFMWNFVAAKDFLPSIAKVEDGIWRNGSWTNDTKFRFTGLEPFTTYNMTFAVRIGGSAPLVFPSRKYITATTGEGIPTPPLRLTVRQANGRSLNVVWDPPQDMHGVFNYYTLYSSPPVPPVARPSLYNNVTIQGYFRPNRDYTFWVTATNRAHTSEPSRRAVITFDEVGDVDELANATMSRLNESAVYIQWHRLPGIEGFVVQPRYPENYAKPPPIKTKALNVTLTDLPPGVTVYVDIRAYKNSDVGKPFSISVNNTGEPDETLTLSAILLREKRTSVQLSWNPPKGARYKDKKIVYELFYTNMMRKMVPGESSDDDFAEMKVTTSNTSVLVEGLNACDSYVFYVGMVRAPLSMPQEIMTRESDQAPVKNLHFNYDDDQKTLDILWDANCDVIRDPVTYRIDITELTLDKKSVYTLDQTSAVTLNHRIKDIPMGARFNVCVEVNVESAAQRCASIVPHEIPPPENVVAFLSQSGHVMVSWREFGDELKLKNYHYEVLISQNEIPEDIVRPPPGVAATTALMSPLLAWAPPGARMLYAAVRVVAPPGYCSDISEVHTLTMESTPEELASPAGALWWGAACALAALVALVAALVHALIRHRRLSRSFLRFTAATPRYDSRRGEATIGDHDDEDMPAIHGFSDDEPLVVA